MSVPKIYDIPSMRAQVHIHHSPDGNTVYGGCVKPYGHKKYDPVLPLNGYEASMAELRANQLDIKPIK